MRPGKYGSRLATFLLFIVSFLVISLVGLSVYLGRDIPIQLVKSFEKIILALLTLIAYIVRRTNLRGSGQWRSFLADLRKSSKVPQKDRQKGRRDPE
jgi:hypothetical protein